MPSHQKRVLFLVFVASGFCGLLYQVVWIRLALSAYGVITPIVSVVVSVFMLGLALGSWLGGRWIAPLSRATGVSAVAYYAAAEAVIASGALIVPWLFDAGRAALLPLGGMESGSYLFSSALLISVTMLPWCFCMGVTYPFAMAYISERDEAEEASFSFLYLGNVIGAMCGAVLTSFVLIELIGFRNALHVAGLINLLIALVAVLLWRLGASVDAPRQATAPTHEPAPSAAPSSPSEVSHSVARLLLFLTGFASMALEIVWMRAFTPVLGTLVYAFSGLLAVYLLATWLGSLAYRRSRDRSLSVIALLTLTALAALLPNVGSDPRAVVAINRLYSADGLSSLAIPLALASIFPFCALLGYLTPMLVDQDSRGRASQAGIAYAINIVGSILGPLVAAYLLLPWLGSRLSMLLLACPFILLFPVLSIRSPRPLPAWQMLAAALAAASVFAATGFWGISYEEGSHIRDAEVRRDHTATVISYGEGLRSHLVVNGHGMTTLSPLTKVMAHLPLVSLPGEPHSALVIAFGMGTTYRSMLTWDIEVTAVELVPSVVDAFDYYFPDAEKTRSHPKGRIVVDDGRRFLARTDQQFDVITIDPPPPVEAAGSSLLYAKEFYSLAKRRLAPGGILHQWFPNGVQVEPAARQAVLRSILDSFPHVRVFRSMQGLGLHILCSMTPIDVPDAELFAERLPAAARRDLLEWSPARTGLHSFITSRILERELELDTLIRPEFEQTITDDRPFNEYFMLRRFWGL